ncbi:hypothetical protein SUGI_0032410 [Cryptomeria japonica]|nr:hypothetical protein SUGI_0032410 [Cryptomeria japonica]
MTKSGSLKKSLSLRFVMEAAIGLGTICTPHKNALELARVLQCLARIKETIGRRKPSTAPSVCPNLLACLKIGRHYTTLLCIL